MLFSVYHIQIEIKNRHLNTMWTSCNTPVHWFSILFSYIVINYDNAVHFSFFSYFFCSQNTWFFFFFKLTDFSEQLVNSNFIQLFHYKEAPAEKVGPFQQPEGLVFVFPSKNLPSSFLQNLTEITFFVNWKWNSRQF